MKLLFCLLLLLIALGMTPCSFFSMGGDMLRAKIYKQL